MSGWVGGCCTLEVILELCSTGWHISHEIFLGRVCTYYFIGRKPDSQGGGARLEKRKVPCGFC